MLWELIKWSLDVKSFALQTILLTSSLWNIMEIWMENLYVDMGALRVKDNKK